MFQEKDGIDIHIFGTFTPFEINIILQMARTKEVRGGDSVRLLGPELIALTIEKSRLTHG